MAIIINCGEWEISSHHFLCPIYGLCILVLTRCLASGRNECGACLDWQLTCDVLACPNDNNNKSNSLLFGIGKKSIGKYSISHTIRWDAATIAIGMQIENHKWNISIYVRVRIYFGHIRSRHVPWRRINNPISIFSPAFNEHFQSLSNQKVFQRKIRMLQNSNVQQTEVEIKYAEIIAYFAEWRSKCGDVCVGIWKIERTQFIFIFKWRNFRDLLPPSGSADVKS